MLFLFLQILPDVLSDVSEFLCLEKRMCLKPRSDNLSGFVNQAYPNRLCDTILPVCGIQEGVRHADFAICDVIFRPEVSPVLKFLALKSSGEELVYQVPLQGHAPRAQFALERLRTNNSMQYLM